MKEYVNTPPKYTFAPAKLTLAELDASLVYTTDPAMVTKGSKAMPVQGGFILVRPDLEVYEALRAIVREVRSRFESVHIFCRRPCRCDARS